MALEDANLDIPGLAVEFKRKEEVAAAAESAAAAAAGAAPGEGVESSQSISIPYLHFILPLQDYAARYLYIVLQCRIRSIFTTGEEVIDATEDDAPVTEPVTLATFRKVLDTLSEQRSQMEALPGHSDVHVIRVQLEELKVSRLEKGSFAHNNWHSCIENNISLVQ